MKPRTFIAKKNLYSYFGEMNWVDDNPTEYGREYGVTAKDVRDDLLQDTLYKGTRLTLVENDDDNRAYYPYGLARKNGDIAVFLENENDIDLNYFEEEA